jgi:hypothetical protein
VMHDHETVNTPELVRSTPSEAVRSPKATSKSSRGIGSRVAARRALRGKPRVGTESQPASRPQNVRATSTRRDRKERSVRSSR